MMLIDEKSIYKEWESTYYKDDKVKKIIDSVLKITDEKKSKDEIKKSLASIQKISNSNSEYKKYFDDGFGKRLNDINKYIETLKKLYELYKYTKLSETYFSNYSSKVSLTNFPNVESFRTNDPNLTQYQIDITNIIFSKIYPNFINSMKDLKDRPSPEFKIDKLPEFTYLFPLYAELASNIFTSKINIKLLGKNEYLNALSGLYNIPTIPKKKNDKKGKKNKGKKQQGGDNKAAKLAAAELAAAVSKIKT